MKKFISLILFSHFISIYQATAASTPTKSSTSRPKSSNSPAPRLDPDDPRVLLPLKCGLNTVIASKLIVGGIRTEPFHHPWIAALEYDTPKGRLVACGGSLITSRHVLTAGHCINPGLPKGWRLRVVRLGVWNISAQAECNNNLCKPGPIDVPVEREMRHELYHWNTSNLVNDIALLKLAHKVNFNDWVQPICLPITPDVPAFMEVLGWGRTEHGPQSEILLQANIPFADKQQCESVLRGYNFVKLSSSQICAGGQAGIDSCTGDSGGPLMGYNEGAKSDEANSPITGRSRRSVVGIVSFGSRRCGTEGYPAVYTKVYDYIPWILNKIRLSNVESQDFVVLADQNNPKDEKTTAGGDGAKWFFSIW